MHLFKLLEAELESETEGAYAPYYYRYLGYREALAQRPATLRAAGIASLFSEPTPVILKSEWIAGNLKSLFCKEAELTLDYARRITEGFSERRFTTNKDHFAPNYRRILSGGIGGLLSALDASLETHRGDKDRSCTLQAMKKTVLALRRMIERYAEAAERCKDLDGYDGAQLSFIAENCRRIARGGRPQSFAEALQLVFFCHLAFLMEGRYAMALGRMDQYLYPFYKADIEAGRITEDFAVTLLENVFIKLKNDVVNICIGGQSPSGECEINPLSYLILRAVGSCHIPGPNLSLRYTQDTPDAFLDECLKVIGTGLGYPALMNDDVNIAALRCYGYAEEDVYDYCMVGCIENFITGKQPPWTDGRFDTPMYMDHVFNRGVSRASATLGLDLGDPESIGSMEEFLSRYEAELAYGAQGYVAGFFSRNDSINQAYFPEPFLSCFCDDCIGRGLDINGGGSVYPSVHGVAVMGIGTVADSLAAIERVVFVDKEATLVELRDALNANFEGYEPLRQKLLAGPKYGNTDPFADKYAVWFINYLSSVFDRYRTRDGGGIYIAAAANVDNIASGRLTGATPDGRLRGEPLSDAASPTHGKDTRGATATYHSLTKPDYTKVACGSVVNQKFSPSMFSDEKRGKLLALIKTYFKKGGQEMQINATSKEVLNDAMAHPEKYGDLVVRVSGFSAFYVTLKKAVQQDILNRTQQE